MGYKKLDSTFQSRLDIIVKMNGGFSRFAKEIDVDPSMVYRWLTGKVRPSFVNLEKLRDFGVDLNWLIGG